MEVHFVLKNVTDDPGSKPDQIYMLGGEIGKITSEEKGKKICLYDILVQCEGVDFKVTCIKFMIVFIRRMDAACF